jgi:alkylated DNA nucleotide flippase Atl1
MDFDTYKGSVRAGRAVPWQRLINSQGNINERPGKV